MPPPPTPPAAAKEHKLPLEMEEPPPKGGVLLRQWGAGRPLERSDAVLESQEFELDRSTGVSSTRKPRGASNAIDGGENDVDGLVRICQQARAGPARARGADFRHDPDGTF